MKCKLLDVFTAKPFNGNGLTLFYDIEGGHGDNLSEQKMMQLTQEMRQFESLFVSPSKAAAKNDNRYSARIFTMEEELDFAGHPLIGLGAHLHEEYGEKKEHTWVVELNTWEITLQTKASKDYFESRMQLGKPEFIKTLSSAETETMLTALNLSIHNKATHPLEVISNGLPYLLVPVTTGLDQAQISHQNFEALLATHGAKFVYILDVKNIEGRTWDNAGKVEDVATGSAAGPAAAYLWKHKLLPNRDHLSLSQGRFVGRPSIMTLWIDAQEGGIENIELRGQVCKVANIEFV